MTKGKLLAVCCIWLVVLVIGAVLWRAFFRAAPPDQPSRYEHEITFALDSFSGYAVFRSEEFRKELAKKKIRLTLEDDGADYSQRARALKQGDVQLAVFTVDALVKACSELGDPPATIVAVVDETRGADAMVAHKREIPNVDALDDPRTKFVLTPDSPSETLARVVMAHFDLDNLGDEPFREAKDAEDVFRTYQQSKPDLHQVYVLWEPYVAKVLENPNMHVVVDSSRFRGYIVDVIVASPEYLARGNDDVVADFVEAYHRALKEHAGDMVQLVLDDAEAAETPLTPQQAEKLVRGIRWKNTHENYAHFGLEPTEAVQHIEDVIANITRVLTDTKAVPRDPTRGKPNLLYYDKVLARLRKAAFPDWDEEVRDDRKELEILTDDRWKRLVPVGTMQVPPLVFARGTATLTEQSRTALDDLAKKLESWPQYYLRIEGDASRRGDLEANKALALARAKAAEQYLIQKGISRNRVRAVEKEPSGNTSVFFVLGRAP